MLLYQTETQVAFETLSHLRPSGHPATWPGISGLAYWHAVGEMRHQVEGLFSDADIDRYVGDWPQVKTRIRNETMSAGIGFVAGRHGRGRQMTLEPIHLAVRSLALRLSRRLSPSEADDAAANESNAARPQRYWTTSSSVGVYRKRLRDRVP